MRIAARRDRRAPATGWLALAAAVLVHGAVLGTVHAIGVSKVGGFGGAKLVADDASELRSGCVGDAMLAASARYALCFAPWHGDTDACLDESFNDMWIDLSSCQRGDDQSIAQIAMVEPKQVAKIKAIDPEPLLEEMKQPSKPAPTLAVAPPPPAPAPPPPPPPARPMQVVETAKPSNQQAPEQARFLSEYDTRTEKQTVARGTPKEPMVAKSKPSELAAKADPQEASVKEHPIDRPPGRDANAPDVPGTLAMRTPGAEAPADVQQERLAQGTSAGADGPATPDGYMMRRGQGAISQERHDRTEVPHGESGAGGGAPDVPNLKPSQDVLERALGGGNVDHMEDVDNGDETALNSKRWIYASFFNRMKRQVAQNWDPASVWHRDDPTGQVYGFKTRVTEVRVSLSTTGSLAKIVVIGPCGFADLDDEAVHAFHLAAPFPNPPKELAGADNLITFGFSFFFEIGAPRSSWRVLRSM